MPIIRPLKTNAVQRGPGVSEGRILVIEDDQHIISLLEHPIADLGFEMESVEDGQSGLQKALANDYALIVLDLMLPSLGGLEVCRRLREAKGETPILMLTGRSEDVDKVLGLELGADDYMTKPFSVAEFRARVRALMRRSARVVETGVDEVLEFEGLKVDMINRQVYVRGQPIELTKTEYDLLVSLALNPGRTITRDELLEEIWGGVAGYGRTINSHMSRLRAKIEPDPLNPKYIVTMRGVGYRFIAHKESGG